MFRKSIINSLTLTGSDGSAEHTSVFRRFPQTVIADDHVHSQRSIASHDRILSAKGSAEFKSHIILTSSVRLYGSLFKKDQLQDGAFSSVSLSSQHLSPSPWRPPAIEVYNQSYIRKFH